MFIAIAVQPEFPNFDDLNRSPHGAQRNAGKGDGTDLPDAASLHPGYTSRSLAPFSLSLNGADQITILSMMTITNPNKIRVLVDITPVSQLDENAPGQGGLMRHKAAR